MKELRRQLVRMASELVLGDPLRRLRSLTGKRQIGYRQFGLALDEASDDLRRMAIRLRGAAEALEEK